MTKFPDILECLSHALAEFGTFGIQTPPDLEDHLPFVEAQILGGYDNFMTDEASVHIGVFTADYSGQDITEQIRQKLIPGQIVTAAGVLDRVYTELRPMEVPYTDGSTVRHFVTQYRVSARRRLH